MDDNLAVDGHNKLDARHRGCSHLLELSARRCCIIYPGQFLTGGLPTVRRGDIGAVTLQYCLPSTAPSSLQITSPEAGFRGGVYGDNTIAQ